MKSTDLAKIHVISASSYKLDETKVEAYEVIVNIIETLGLAMSVILQSCIRYSRVWQTKRNILALQILENSAIFSLCMALVVYSIVWRLIRGELTFVTLKNVS